jgi:hypothetical protein
MRYCTNCRHITPGQPLFCNYCGRSYDVKLCPSRHPNPRSATVCSQCGSHELSVPQPLRSLPKRLLVAVLRIAPGLFLLLVTVLFFLGLVEELLRSPVIQAQALCLGLVLAVLWWLYMQLPGFVRGGIRRVLKKRKGKGQDHGH